MLFNSTSRDLLKNKVNTKDKDITSRFSMPHENSNVDIQVVMDDQSISTMNKSKGVTSTDF